MNVAPAEQRRGAARSTERYHAVLALSGEAGAAVVVGHGGSTSAAGSNSKIHAPPPAAPRAIHAVPASPRSTARRAVDSANARLHRTKDLAGRALSQHNSLKRQALRHQRRVSELEARLRRTEELCAAQKQDLGRLRAQVRRKSASGKAAGRGAGKAKGKGASGEHKPRRKLS